MADKEFKTYSEQLKILTDRNLKIEHKRKFKTILQRESYYNVVNGYKKYFLATLNPEKYITGTTFDQIYELYSYDQNLRAIFLLHLLRIEKQIKTLIAYHFSELYGHDHLKYLDTNNFNNSNPRNVSKAARLISDINCDINHYAAKCHNSIVHYLTTYHYVPMWVLTNILTFGRVNTFYSRMKLPDQQAIAAHFNLSASVFEGFIRFISDFRNKCAHGERLYTAKNTGETKLKIIPNTTYHILFSIPKNSTGNYIAGKTDILALLISLKLFLPSAEFLKVLKSFQAETNRLRAKIPPAIMANIESEMGIRNIDLNKLK